MPLYEYRCRVCYTSFQLLRAVKAADDPAPCPSGHSDVVRALSLVAPVRRGGVMAAPASGGGCCGGACGCGH
jgi:putative FmdB family regulatory protein